MDSFFTWEVIHLTAPVQVLLYGNSYIKYWPNSTFIQARDINMFVQSNSESFYNWVGFDGYQDVSWYTIHHTCIFSFIET